MYTGFQKSVDVGKMTSTSAANWRRHCNAIVADITDRHFGPLPFPLFVVPIRGQSVADGLLTAPMALVPFHFALCSAQSTDRLPAMPTQPSMPTANSRPPVTPRGAQGNDQLPAIPTTPTLRGCLAHPAHPCLSPSATVSASGRRRLTTPSEEPTPTVPTRRHLVADVG